MVDAKPERKGKRFQGARAQRGGGAERASPRAHREASAWRSGSPRTRRSLAPPERARVRRSFFPSDPPRSSTSASGGAERERGSVGRGGRGVARERGQPKKGRGGRDPRQRYPANTQSGAGLTPPPPLTLLAGRPQSGRGWPWGWGGQGAGTRRKALAGSDGGG